MTTLAVDIRRAARHAYETHGPDAVSARKLAGVLGVSQMAMYRHYRTKDELLAAVAAEGFGELTALLETADAIADPFERLMARAQRWLDFALRHPLLFDLMFRAPRREARRFPRDFRAQRSSTGILFEADIRHAMQRGAIPPGDPLEIGLALWSTMHGFI